MTTEIKKEEISLDSIKEYYKELKNKIVYENILSYVEKNTIDKTFRDTVIKMLNLCFENGKYNIEKNVFTGTYETKVFTLIIKHPTISYKIEDGTRVEMGKTFFSNSTKSYVCYKNREVIKYCNMINGNSSTYYDTYDVNMTRTVIMYDKKRIVLGRFEEESNENYYINKETGERFLSKPTELENYTIEKFFYTVGNELYIKQIKEYTNQDFNKKVYPYNNCNPYLKGKSSDIYFVSISKEKAESLSFPTDEEIKVYKKLMIG